MDVNFWQAIHDSDYAVPAGYTVAALTPELVEHLGSTDGRLRDQLALEILDEWVARDGVYTDAELCALAAQMLAGLEGGLGESGTETVFRRAFSALILGSILGRDTRRPFLTAAVVHAWLDAALHYLRAERDLRGYVPGQGWAHGIAHAGDLLISFVRSAHVQAPELERILDAIAARMTAPADRVFHYLEDERLALAAMAVLHRNLLEMSFLTGWLERLAHPPGAGSFMQASKDAEPLHAFQNARQFLRTLYFQLNFGVSVAQWFPDPAPFDRPIALRDALLAETLQKVRSMGPRFYVAESAAL